MKKNLKKHNINAKLEKDDEGNLKHDKVKLDISKQIQQKIRDGDDSKDLANNNVPLKLLLKLNLVKQKNAIDK